MQLPEAETMYSVPQRQQILQEALREERSKSQVTRNPPPVKLGQSTSQSESLKPQTPARQLFLLKRVPNVVSNSHKDTAIPLKTQPCSICPPRHFSEANIRLPSVFGAQRQLQHSSHQHLLHCFSCHSTLRCTLTQLF